MKILQWLFKVTCEQGRQSTSIPSAKKETIHDCEDHKSKHILLFKHCRLRGKLASKIFKPFKILYRRNSSKDCFNSTLNLKKTFGRFNRRHCRIHSMKTKKEDVDRGVGVSHKVDSASHVGNKVLPISETALPTSTNTNDQCCSSEKKDMLKGDKANTMTRMKELLRWAAVAKSEKGGKFIFRKVLQFRNRGTPKAVQDDEQLSNESPKISFCWDVECCSTTSSAYSAMSMASSSNLTLIQDKDHIDSRRGNWITTDSEFVVLEL